MITDGVGNGPHANKTVGCDVVGVLVGETLFRQHSVLVGKLVLGHEFEGKGAPVTPGAQVVAQ